MRISVAAVCAVSLVGIAHAPFARGLLAKVGGCPVARASAADVENARMVGVRATRGSAMAPARPALGFALDRTTRAEVDAWTKKNGLACTSKVEGMRIVCKDVPSSALADRPATSGTVGEINFAFRPRDGALVNVTAVTTGLSPDAAAQRATETGERLVGALGAPESGAARVTREALASGSYATAHLAFRFADYMSEVTATSIPERGVLLREHYISAVE